MKKGILLILSVLMLTPVLAACGGAGDWDYIEKKGEIVIGYDNHFAPMGFVLNNEDVGFDLEVARAIESSLGVKVKLQAIKWDSKEVELKAKNIDLIWNGYTVTEKRKGQVLFSESYLKNEQVIVIRKEDEGVYTSSADLAGKKLVAQRGSSAKDAILATEAIKDIPADSSRYTELEENETVLMELGQKRHDAAVMDSVVARYYTEKVENNVGKFVILSEVLAEEEYAIGIRKGATETKKKIDAALHAIKEDGTLDTIAEKWGLKELLLIK